MIPRSKEMNERKPFSLLGIASKQLHCIKSFLRFLLCINFDQDLVVLPFCFILFIFILPLQYGNALFVDVLMI